jgi:hypothetical protein
MEGGYTVFICFDCKVEAARVYLPEDDFFSIECPICGQDCGHVNIPDEELLKVSKMAEGDLCNSCVYYGMPNEDDEDSHPCEDCDGICNWSPEVDYRE